MKDAGPSPATTKSLSPSEMRFVAAMQRLWFGRFENIRIQAGELVLDPWPTTIRNLKFNPESSAPDDRTAIPFKLKEQVAELFRHIRSLEVGEIQTLQIRHGLPYSMEIITPMPADLPQCTDG